MGSPQDEIMVSLRRMASKEKGKEADKTKAAADKAEKSKPAANVEVLSTRKSRAVAKFKEEVVAEETAKQGKAETSETKPASSSSSNSSAGAGAGAGAGAQPPEVVVRTKKEDVAKPDKAATEEKKPANDGGTEGGGEEASPPITTAKPGAGATSAGAATAKGPPQEQAASSREPKHGADHAGNAGQAEEGGNEDDSSEDDGDGFRIVVGRERETAAAPAAPAKRFLRGTNTLVNTPATATGSVGESRPGTSAASKPVSAAAGIASLVPSKGAPVKGTRPMLKPGEYPPTAELQVQGGKSAFDVDIDGMEEQPWRHPGVDVADFFNYGFTEDSWRVYCEKQLRNRYDKFNRTTTKSVKSSSGNHMRHGGGGPRRGGDRPGGLDHQRSMQPHNSGLPGRGSFPPQGPPGPPDAWGPGPRPGPPGGMGGTGGPHQWFDGPGAGPPHMYPPGGGQNMPPPPGVGHGRGGDMQRWNGDRQGVDFRAPDGSQRDGRIAGDSVGGSQDQRPGGNSLMDALRNSGASGVKRSLSPTPPRRGY